MLCMHHLFGVFVDVLMNLFVGGPFLNCGVWPLKPVQDPDGMTATIVKALEKTNQRGLIDRGWGGIGSKCEFCTLVVVDECQHRFKCSCSYCMHRSRKGSPFFYLPHREHSP